MDAGNQRRRIWRSRLIRFGIPAICVVIFGYLTASWELEWDTVTGKERHNTKAYGIWFAGSERDTKISSWLDSNASARNWIRVAESRPRSWNLFVSYVGARPHPCLSSVRFGAEECEKCLILNAILANEPSGYPDHEALTKLLVRYILDDLQATEKICDTA
ncbi:MAG: hypothetical protein ACI8UO_004788, partial [Verrucomicrobiales bacterium]